MARSSSAPRGSWLANAAAVDLRSIRRDDLLAWVGLAPLLLALFLRFALPPLARILATELAFDLAPYYPLLAGFFLLMAPGMVGMVAGFLLLDERDEGVLTALAVTPLPPGRYLAYRIAGPMAIGWLVTLACYPLAALVPLPLPDLLAISLLAAASGPTLALCLGAFAANKVAGFALVKVINLVQMVPVVAFFLPPGWQLAAGIVPSYWPLKMTWLAAAGEPWWLHALAGVAVNAAAVALLARRMGRRMGR